MDFYMTACNSNTCVLAADTSTADLLANALMRSTTASVLGFVISCSLTMVICTFVYPMIRGIMGEEDSAVESDGIGIEMEESPAAPAEGSDEDEDMDKTDQPKKPPGYSGAVKGGGKGGGKKKPPAYSGAVKGGGKGGGKDKSAVEIGSL